MTYLKLTRFSVAIAGSALSILVSGNTEKSASAATLTFTKSADFFAALGTTQTITETYDSLPIGTVISPGTTVDDITYNSFNSSFSNNVLLGGQIDHYFQHIGTASLAAKRTMTNPGYFFNGDSFTVSFSHPVTAIGIFFNSLPTTIGDLYIDTPVGTATTGSPHDHYDFSTFFFAGLTSDTPFQTATIGSNTDKSFNVDNLTYTVPAVGPDPTYTVPEPDHTGGVLAFGALGGGVLSRQLGKRTRQRTRYTAK